jgi:hypothetical protein
MKEIAYLEREAIDTAKWDECIESADNGRIYAYSFYLDVMAVHWGALVAGNYEMVMPLPWKKKWGFRYIYTPRFTSPLGIFGTGDTRSRYTDFLQAIPAAFSLWDIDAVDVPDRLPAFVQQTLRTDHMLDLSRDYESACTNYRSSYRSLIHKEKSQGQYSTDQVPIEHALHLAAAAKHTVEVREDDYTRFRKLYGILSGKQMASCMGVFTSGGVMQASAVFFQSHNRIYYMLAANTPAGRKSGASHQLLDAVIAKYSGKPLLLDFEGSDIPGVAFFFEGFGAYPVKYSFIHYNRLPWWCKWMKKPPAGLPASGIRPR